VKDINRKRLEWMAKAKVGDEFPAELFHGSGYTGWSDAVREAAADAIDELASFRGIKVDIANEIVHIDGIKYARSLFEGVGLQTPVGKWIRIVRRENGCVVIEMAPEERVLNEPLNEETSA
jgi:hypothetical protein